MQTAETISVLLVEDCPEHAEVIRIHLDGVVSRRYRVTHVASKQEAMEVLRSGSFDVGLIDYRLGDELGIDLIREAIAEVTLVPFIVLTSHTDSSIDLAAMEAGAVDYLEKASLNPRALERSIRYAVQRRGIESSLAKAHQIEESSKMYMQAVLDSLSTYIAVIDAEGRIERANEAWQQQDDETLPFGARFAEGDLLFDGSAGSSDRPHDGFWSSVQRVRDGEVDRASDVVCFPTERSFRWFLISVTRPHGLFGDRFVVACEDVTTARSHERKARLLEKAFETTTEGILITDAKHPSHPITYVNAGFEKISGYQRGEAIGRNCGLLQGPQTDLTAVARIRQAIQAGETCHVEMINHRKDGTPFWNELRLAPILAEDGTVEHYVGVQSDVTARKDSEHELRESRARFDRAVRGSAEALWEWDSATEKLWLSPLWQELLGYDEDELPHYVSTFEKLLHKDDHEPTMAALMRHLNHHEPYDVEYRLRTKAGDYRWFRARGVAEFDEDGTPRRMSGSAQEITDRKATEALLRDKESQLRHKQRMEAVGSLAGGIAHEFNNLLHVIKGYTEFAVEQYEKDGTVELDDLHEALGASNRAARLTRQLLDFSRSEEPELTREDANTIVEDLRALIRPLLGEHVEFRTHLSEPPIPIRADRTLFTQALMNLCVNARDAMPDGGTLMICTERVYIGQQTAALRGDIQPGRYVRLSLTDTGCGIPADLLGRIFDPFFTTKEAGKGTGMGLAFVYSVVEQHQGMVNVSSEPGTGTTFEVYIPLCHIEHENETASGTENESPAQNAPLILVAEDEKTVLKVAQRILTRAGYTTITAENGEEAILQFRQNADRISLVLLDIMMPRLTGRAALEEIRRIRADVPAVFCTGYDPGSEQLERASELGVPIVEKPFTKQQLLNAIQTALNAEPNGNAGHGESAVGDGESKSLLLAPRAADPQSINHEELLERCMGNLDFAQELLDEFEVGLLTRLEKMTLTMKAGNTEETASAAHSLKGAAGIIGADALQRLAATIEMTGRTGCAEELPPLLKELHHEVHRFYNALQETRSKLSGTLHIS